MSEIRQVDIDDSNKVTPSSTNEVGDKSNKKTGTINLNKDYGTAARPPAASEKVGPDSLPGTIKANKGYIDLDDRIR